MSGIVRYEVWVPCSALLGPLGDLGYLAIDQFAQLELSFLTVIYYSEQLVKIKTGVHHKGKLSGRDNGYF
jgi:hypothetical protein